MARILDGEVYLTPQEASALLHVSYKTLQRWADARERQIWVERGGQRVKETQPVRLSVRFTPTGYRLYSRDSVERLREAVSTPNGYGNSSNGSGALSDDVAA